MLLLHTNEGIYYNRPLETDISLRNQMYGDWRISLGMKINYSVQRKTTYDRGCLHIRNVRATELFRAFETDIYL